MRVIYICAALALAGCGKADPASVSKPDPAEAARTSPSQQKQAKSESGRATNNNLPPRSPGGSRYDVLRDRNLIKVNARYNDENSKKRKADFEIQCSSGRQWLVIFSDGPPGKLPPGSFIPRGGDTKTWTSNSRGFWAIEDVEVLFDGKPGELLSAYEEITKERIVNGVKTESKFPQLREPIAYIEDALIPKLKTSDTMQVKFESGLGPIFDLTGMKAKIEQLETQCE